MPIGYIETIRLGLGKRLAARMREASALKPHRVCFLPSAQIGEVEEGTTLRDAARIAVLNRNNRAEAAHMARRVEYVELTTESGFMDLFTEATHLPHASDCFPSLTGEWLAAAGYGL